MTSTGETFILAGGWSYSSAPHSDEAWYNPAGTWLDDAVSAFDDINCASITANTFDSGDQSELLLIQNADFLMIPDNSTILGITCRVNAWYQNGSGSIDYMQLIDAGGSFAGTDQCSTAVPLTTTPSTIITKGSSADMWGTAFTTADVQSASFGVAIGVLSTAANTDVYVDYISLEIEYAEVRPPPITNAPIARYYG